MVNGTPGKWGVIEVMGSLNVVEACLVENSNGKWIIDLGATNHICYSLKWFKQSRPLKKWQRTLKLGNGEYVFVMSVGLVELWFKNFTFIRPFICFQFKRNLVSISCLLNMV